MKPSVENQMAAVKQSAGTPQKQFTRQEIEKHDKEDDCWIVVDGKVYDATSVLEWHPGGKAAVLSHAGKVHAETSNEFESIHDGYAYKKLNGQSFNYCCCTYTNTPNRMRNWCSDGQDCCFHQEKRRSSCERAVTIVFATQ
jgi:nitrate reductase (NAD(P)H)